MEPNTSKYRLFFFCEEEIQGNPINLSTISDTFNFGAIYILIESTQGQYLRY